MTPRNKRLYEKVKEEAKLRFKRWPSAYGSAWLVKEYKRRGGEFDDDAGSPRDGVSRWMREEWVQVVPYLKSGKVMACGSRKDAAKACRPLRRISKDTPPTIDELIGMHGKKTVMTLAKYKIRDMDGRVHWKRGIFYPSI